MGIVRQNLQHLSWHNTRGGKRAFVRAVVQKREGRVSGKLEQGSAARSADGPQSATRQLPCGHPKRRRGKVQGSAAAARAAEKTGHVFEQAAGREEE